MDVFILPLKVKKVFQLFWTFAAATIQVCKTKNKIISLFVPKNLLFKFSLLALNCPRAEEGQISCPDCPDCPECDLGFIHIEQPDDLYSATVTVQNVLNQLPSAMKIKIATELFGAFAFEHLNQSVFRDRNGKYIVNIKLKTLLIHFNFLLVVDHHGKRLVTRLVLSGNYGQTIHGRSKPKRKFLEVFYF